jgi:hypothetical protein
MIVVLTQKIYSYIITLMQNSRKIEERRGY